MVSFIGNVQVTEDDLDLLQLLSEVNGKNGTVFIYDDTMKTALRQQGYIHTNNIGQSWGTDKLKTVLPRIKNTFVAK